MSRLGEITALELLTPLDARCGRHLAAARLLGVTTAHRARLRWQLPPVARLTLEADHALLETALGRKRLDAAMAEGTAMTLKEAAAYARRGRGEPAGKPSQAGPASPLTEVE